MAMNSFDAQEAFKEAMLRDLGAAPDSLVEGELKRFDDAEKKRGNKNCWYVFHYHEPWAAGAYGSWREDVKATWSLGSQDLFTDEERAEFARKRREIEQQRQAAEAQRHQEAAAQAKRLWSEAEPADPEHLYLIKKQIPPGAALQNQYGQLVLPIIDFNKQLWSLQWINAHGSKRFLTGGKKKGCFIPLQRPDDAEFLIICEGWSTGQTLAITHPDAIVIAALDAYNLTPVALGAQQHFPNVYRMIAADDDRTKEHNIGQEQAKKAAEASGAQKISPAWPEGAPKELSDFNDLACWLSDQCNQVT